MSGRATSKTATGLDLCVTVVIPNWNGERHLRACLESLRSQTLTTFETVLVDNGSTDSGLELVRSEFPEVHVLETGANLGFAGAVNFGLRVAGTPLVALLNNDTVVDSLWLERLVAAADCHDDAHSFASQMVLYSDPTLMNAAGDEFRFGRGAAENRGLRCPVADYADSAWVFGACAGASMYRRSFFDLVGLFDEKYFLMHEDTDLNARGQLLGLHCLYVPGAIVAHKVGASINTMPSASSLALAWRNEVLVVAKTMPLPLLLLELPCIAWRDARETLLMKPSAWSASAQSRSLLRVRLKARWEGLVLGTKSRRSLPRRVVTVGEFVRSFRAHRLDR